MLAAFPGSRAPIDRARPKSKRKARGHGLGMEEFDKTMKRKIGRYLTRGKDWCRAKRG
jgi:hypothetical protein